MKLKRPKIHLLRTSEPLLAFHGLGMLCGATLQNALMVYGLSLEIRVEAGFPLQNWLCPNCRMHIADPPAPEEIATYEYGLVEKREWQAWLEARGQDGTEIVEVGA